MSDTSHSSDDKVTRRDFIHLASGGVGAVGVTMAMWPLVDQMNPSADVLALGSTEVDLSAIEVGQSVKVIWRKKPVFIRRRTAAEITAAQDADLADLKDPEADADRVGDDPQWLVMVGVCTHLGCVPLDQKAGGWFCPCHGSYYDTSGRITKGPAPTNLEVPQYAFVEDNKIVIG